MPGNKATAERKVIVQKKEDDSDINDDYDDDMNTSDDDMDDDSNDNTNNDDYYEDTIAPIITFNISDAYQNICTGNSVNISVNGPYGYVARDNVDGNITSRVSITGDTGIINTPGVYNLYYTVSDSSGNRASAYKQFTVRTCGNPIKRPDPVNSVTGIELTPCKNYIDEPISRGQEIQFSATVYPSNATNKSVIYSSTKTNVASVTQSGRVKGLSSGTTSIVATSADGRIKGVCNLRVK